MVSDRPSQDSDGKVNLTNEGRSRGKVSRHTIATEKEISESLNYNNLITLDMEGNKLEVNNNSSTNSLHTDSSVSDAKGEPVTSSFETSINSDGEDIRDKKSENSSLSSDGSSFLSESILSSESGSRSNSQQSRNGKKRRKKDKKNKNIAEEMSKKYGVSTATHRKTVRANSINLSTVPAAL